MEEIRALIVDDEWLARKRIADLLDGHREVAVVAQCGDGESALEAMARHRPDLVFLDVQMPVWNGFEVLERLKGDLAPVVVFVTAYDRYALRAFEVHALDYLLKPFDDERFHTALDRALRQIKRERIARLRDRMFELMRELGPEPSPVDSGKGGAGGGSEHPPYLDRLVLRSGGRICFLDADEVDWVEAEGSYVRLHTGGRSHLLRQTVAGLEAVLDPKRFVRIHRSFMVNLERIAELRTSRNGALCVVLRNGPSLRVSRGYRESLQRVLGV